MWLLRYTMAYQLTSLQKLNILPNRPVENQ
jgi:hypothetical protein